MKPATLLHTLLLASLLTSCGSNGTNKDRAAKDAATILTLTEAYGYGLPLVVMDLTRRQMTNPSSGGAMNASVNQFHHLSKFPDASFRNVVRPNADTYYSSAILDLSAGPIILSLPNTRGRYYMMPMLDAWTNVFASPGTRTTGNGAGDFCITGPGWSGTLPAGLKQIKAPTSLVWIIGRTQVNSKTDGVRIVIPLQKKYKLTPLSAWLGKPAAPIPSNEPTPPKGDPNSIVEKMPADSFFNYMLRLMKKYPAPEADTPFLERLAAVGLRTGDAFDPAEYDTTVQNALRTIPTRVLSQLKNEIAFSHALVNGWNVIRTGIGSYGTDYHTRSMVAYTGLGANLPADAIYPHCNVDADGSQLNGARNYLLHFKKGQTPPVNAFWSLTMYDIEGHFVPNPLNRYTLGDRSNLTQNTDGSIDIYIQAASPSLSRQRNWLPAPPGNFNLLMRLYYPKQAAIDGTWLPPAVQKLQ